MEYFAKDKLKTDISLSIESHLIGFAAEESRLNGGMPVTLCKFRKIHDKIFEESRNLNNSATSCCQTNAHLTAR